MPDETSGPSEADAQIDRLSIRTSELDATARAFSRTMANAFASAVVGGKQLDDVLKSLALRLSGVALQAALKPITSGLATGIESLFSGLLKGLGLQAANGAVKPFAAGGVIGTPTYFPMLGGGVGLAGEAGPEAIMPLARGPDGQLGVAASGGGAATSVTINITTPDAESFRRSESYVTGQIARAVSRGQRGL